MLKKVAIWAAVISGFAFVIIWGVLGLNIMNNDYEAVTPLTYSGMACVIVLLASLIVLRWSSWTCPHCGKPRWTNGRYCSYCGKEI